MTADERESLDSSPDWTDEGQILWFLEQRAETNQLASVVDIAAALKTQPSAISWRLRRLAERGKAASHTAARRELWGTTEHVRRLQADELRERRRIQREQEEAARHTREQNQRLAELRRELEQVVAGRDIEVASLAEMFPSPRQDTRVDHLYLATSTPAAAEWLVSSLRRPTPDEYAPSEEEWTAYWERLEKLLSPLEYAGWIEDEEASFGEYDPDVGPLLWTRMHRTCMALGVEYRTSEHTLSLQPDDGEDDELALFSVLDEEVPIALTGDLDDQRRAVRDHVGELGMLGPTRVALTDDSIVSTTEFTRWQLVDWLLRPAAQDQGVSQLLDQLNKDQHFSSFFSLLTGMLAVGVLPDLVPSAATLGIAAWCWRNETAVEAYHLPGDVLMARVNIAVTQAVRPHVDPVDGVDWDRVKDTLTDPTWALPDGRIIPNLFGDGWPEVRNTVIEELDRWRHLDDHILGPEATLRLLSIAGSTSYTDNWWGQGRWQALCRAVVEDALAAGIALPPPYDTRGSDALLDTLEHPNDLSDDVLEWLIDMPSANITGPRGLRMHDAARPPVRVIELPEPADDLLSDD